MTPLDNLRRIVAGWRGEWRVDAHEGITLSHDGDEWPIASMDGDVMIALVELLNAIRPAVDGATAEIARLTAELAQVRTDKEALVKMFNENPSALWSRLRAAEAELAAARAVPPDVEAAIKSTVDGAEEAGRCSALGHAYLITKAPFWTVPHLKAAIARAIADATAGAVAYFIEGHAKRLCDAAGGVWHDEYDSWASQVHDVLNHLRSGEDGTVIDGRASQPATVGGLLATAPVGSIVEWLDGDGDLNQAVVRVDDRIPCAMHRWRMAGRWCQYGGFDDAGRHLRLTARLVPAHLADADPATRGQIGEVPDVR